MFRPSVPQVFAKVDREKVLKQGMDIQDVYGTLQAFMGGSYINDFNRFGRQWKVYLGAEPEYRVRAEEINNFFIRNGNKEMVPLSSVVNVEKARGPEYTTRFNLMRAAEFNGSPAPGYSSGQAMDALEEVAKEVLSKDFGYAWAGMSYQQKAAPSSVGVFLLSLLFVFLILAAQYESWSLPFSILLGTPICVLGAFLGLFVIKMDLDVFGQIGLIMLIGLAAKNAILIVEFARAELHSGKSLEEATLNGARLRLRPILMTSFAFVLGCVPLLRATGAGAVSRMALGTVVVWGMLAATGIGLFITPALFALIERLTGKKAKAEPPAPEPSAAPHASEAS
jgi:HAE1 family hydrophobic/amphiphilic exporter-1